MRTLRWMVPFTLVLTFFPLLVRAAENLALRAPAWTVLQPQAVQFTPQGIRLEAAGENRQPVAMLTAPLGDDTRVTCRLQGGEGFAFALWQRQGRNPFRGPMDRFGAYCTASRAGTALGSMGTDEAMKVTRWDTPYREFASPWLPGTNEVSFIRYGGTAQFLVNGAATRLPVAGWENTLWMDNREKFSLLLFAGPGPVTLTDVQVTPLQAPARLNAQNAVPITFTLPAEKYVTLVINDAKGNRVRNLLAETKFAKGATTVYWDGRDDFGRLVAPGAYTASGLHRDALHLVYRFSLNNAGQPSWLTADGTGGWLTDHSPPMCALAVGEHIFLSGPGPEANTGLIMTDLHGRRLWGWKNGMGDSPTQMASDGRYLYCLSDQGTSVLYRFDITGEKPKEVPFAGKPRFVEVAQYDLGAYAPHTHGMAYRQGKLYLAHTHVNQVLVYDAETGDREKVFSVPSPRGLAVWENSLYVRSGNTVALLNPDTGELKPALDNAPDGRAIAFDPGGRMYLGDDTTRQVRVYYNYSSSGITPRWRERLVIGTPGGRQLGVYDPKAINTAYGLTVDRQGRAWIAEADFFPKRVSVFDNQGAFVTEFLGPPLYGGGGSIDPRDATRMFYNGVEFTVDWATGKATPYAVVTRIPEPYTQLKMSVDGRGIDGRIYYHGNQRLYVTGGTRMSTSSGGLLISSFDAQERIKPLAMVYMAKMPGAEMRVWLDANGNGAVEEPELSEAVTPKLHGRPFWALGFELAPNFDVYVLGGGGVVFRLPLQGWTPAGAPRYELAKLQLVKATLGGTSAMAVDSVGRVVVLGDLLYGVRPDGTQQWRYPAASIGVHGGGTPGPGRIIGALDFQGTVNLGKAIGDTVLINGNLGQRFLMTTDGLFIASLFRQYGTDGEKPKPATWKGGEWLDETCVGPEPFGGFYGKSGNGKVYLISGREDSKVTEITGLQSLTRFAVPLTLSGADTLRLSRALAARGKAEVGLLHLAEQRTAPLLYLGVDGLKNEATQKAWNGWDGKSWPAKLPISVGPLSGYAQVAYDDTYLYFCGRMMPDQLGRSINSHADWTRLDACGGAWELRLASEQETVRVVMAPGAAQYAFTGTAPTVLKADDPHNLTVIYRRTGEAAPGAVEVREQVRFLAPDGAESTTYRSVAAYRGFIENYSDGQAWPHDGIFLICNAKIPLAALGLALTPGAVVNADVGVTLANDAGTGPLARGCWASPVGGILDNPALAEQVDPAQLGKFIVTAGIPGKQLTVPRLAQGPVVDGALAEWAAVPFTPLLDRPLGEVALAHDGRQLYLAARVHSNAPLRNGGTEWTTLFKTGTALDLQFAANGTRQRLLFAPTAGKPTAVLSRETAQPLAPGVGEVQEQVRYVSPVGSFTMGQVIKLAEAQVVFTPAPDGYVVEAAVPLATLGITPGNRLAGDVGVLLSDQDGVATARRVYWANPETSVVADLPTEARFAPQQWGLLVVEP